MSTLEAIFWGLMGVWVLFISLSMRLEEADWNKDHPYSQMRLAGIPSFGFFVLGGFLVLASIGNLIQ